MSSVDEFGPEGQQSELEFVSEWNATVPANDAVEFISHIVALTRTGLPLPSGLRALAAELPSKRLRHTLCATADKLELGTSLDTAVIELGRAVPPQLRGLIVAGAESGRLADVLGQFVRYASLGATLRRKFWIALAYPVFLITILSLIYLFICYAVVESFEFVMKDFGVDTPMLTRALFAMARFTRQEGGVFLLTGLASAAAVYVLVRLTSNAAQRRRIVTAIPLYGKILRYSTLAEFSHMAGLLVESEMPLPDALNLAAQGVNDADLEQVVTKVRESVQYGRTLSESLAFWPDCPAGLCEVLAGSEGRGDLAPALHLAGDMFEARTRSLVSFATTLCAILTVFWVVWGIGFVFTALYMPMIQLITRLSG